MRLIVVKKDSDLQTVRAVAAEPARAARLARANPHLDFDKLAVGSVVLVPDEVVAADSPLGDKDTIVGDALASFADFAAEALAGAARGVKAGAERTTADAEALVAALRGKSVKEALERDPALREQAEAALKAAKEAGKAVQREVKEFDARQDEARKALEALRKQLG